LILIANVPLIRFPGYAVFFMLQICLYLIAVLAFLLQKYNIEIRFLNILFFFFATNLALMIGFWRNVFGTQGVTWNRTERQ